MHAWRAVLDAMDMQALLGKLDLVPLQLAFDSFVTRG
jgi:hypothetical protein